MVLADEPQRLWVQSQTPSTVTIRRGFKILVAMTTDEAEELRDELTAVLSRGSR